LSVERQIEKRSARWDAGQNQLWEDTWISLVQAGGLTRNICLENLTENLFREHAAFQGSPENQPENLWRTHRPVDRRLDDDPTVPMFPRKGTPFQKGISERGAPLLHVSAPAVIVSRWRGIRRPVGQILREFTRARQRPRGLPYSGTRIGRRPASARGTSSPGRYRATPDTR
jgi:hypothetical protein